MGTPFEWERGLLSSHVALWWAHPPPISQVGTGGVDHLLCNLVLVLKRGADCTLAAFGWALFALRNSWGELGGVESEKLCGRIGEGRNIKLIFQMIQGFPGKFWIFPEKKNGK